ncbi:BTAD domain-containing putative transcriptional regulator [Streptomyces sp. QTS137]
MTKTQSPAVHSGPQVTVEFRALGPVEAMIAGRPVDLGAPKQRTLLALLVSQVGQPVSVDVMMEALWAGHPPPSAMTSLQAYVANLRKLLEPDRAPRRPATVLRTCTQGYLLDVGATDVDARRFVEHAKAGWQARGQEHPQRALSEFEAALALWRGQAYQEVAAVPCVVPEVARLQELRLSVVEMRCAALLDLGAHEMAAAELEAFMKANPLREYGCELLSLALYRAGRQADALEVLQTMRVRLTEELGVDPRMALQHLRRKILNQAPSLDRHPTPALPASPGFSGTAVPPRAGSAGPPPAPDADGEVFVGREAALRQLTEALAAAQAGRGRVVTVSGEPGAGKTSLLRRFAEPTGVPVLWGTCTEHVTAPSLWVWEQVLRAAAAAFPRHSIPRPVSELLDGDTQRPTDGAEPPGAALRRFEAIVQYLTGLSRSGPLVVMLDHLHRADPGSLRLLAHLAESVPASRLLLVVSYRSHEAPVLAETLAALARGEMTRLELEGLTPQDTRALASAVLRREVSSHTAKGLCARTDGNPFFLREMIGLLADDQYVDDPRAAPVPALVREVVLGRIARLPRPAVEVLSVAAVVGRHFDIAVVADVVPVGIDAALAALDTAIAAGLIMEDQRRLGWFRFTHALVAEVLYETTGRLRRARLHRWIGAASGRAGATERAAERAARTARHLLPATEGDPATATATATRASLSIGG